MAELRQDPICGRWVIIATERAVRPGEFGLGRGEPKGGFCPFCEGNEDRTPPEIAAVRPDGGPDNSPGWRVRVVPNKFPALSLDGQLAAHVQSAGHRRRAPGIGTHEVIIESPGHAISPTDMPPADFEHVIATYCRRAEALDADERLAYVLIFKNVGQEAGASIEHCHSQVMGVPVMPRRVAEELGRCEHFYQHHGRCLFCDVLAEDQADGARLVAQTKNFAALSPFAAAFPFTIWLLPRSHAGRLFDMGPAQVAELARLLQETIARVEICLGDPPFNYAIHAAPTAATRRQAECYHWHIELIPRVTRLAGFEWGTGFYINPVEPETAARYLRDVPARQVAQKIAQGAAGGGRGNHSRS
jgi:UDPglucose--hexose-1-phosphate uridylyltransferase